MLANKLALPLAIVSPSSLLKYAWNFCSKCYKLAVTMFHDDSEENRFCLTIRGAGVNWVSKVPEAIQE